MDTIVNICFLFLAFLHRIFRTGHGCTQCISDQGPKSVTFVADFQSLPFLKCGDLKQGFARISCPNCGHEQILSFSCKKRCICGSCMAKRAIVFGHHLNENVFYPVPHRQYVFSIPIMLRIYFKYDRSLLTVIQLHDTSAPCCFKRQVQSDCRFAVQSLGFRLIQVEIRDTRQHHAKTQ